VTDPPAARMGELSASDARLLLERLVAGGPARLDAFVAAVRAGGGPADALDRSLGSLEVLWPWFLVGAPRSAPPDRVAEPWWAPFHPQWASALGPGPAALTTGLAQYFFSCVALQAPGSAWVVSRRASTRRHPVLRIPDRGELDYAVPLRFVVRAFAGDLPGDREPGALRRLAEIWLGLDEAHEAAMAALARPIGPWAVRAIDDRRFTHELGFDESTANRRTGRITRLLEALAREPGIAEVVREDREVALIRAPQRTAAEVEALVERIWSDAGRSHGDATSDVP
jgi:hypothetical protein